MKPADEIAGPFFDRGPETIAGIAAIVVEKGRQIVSLDLLPAGRLPTRDVQHHVGITVQFDQMLDIVHGQLPQDQPLGLQEDVHQRNPSCARFRRCRSHPVRSRRCPPMYCSRRPMYVWWANWTSWTTDFRDSAPSLMPSSTARRSSCSTSNPCRHPLLGRPRRCRHPPQLPCRRDRRRPSKWPAQSKIRDRRRLRHAGRDHRAW